jgi:hypothetical protein
VPIDDESHVRFDIFFNRVRPVERERYECEAATEMIGHRYRRNRENRYLQDRAQMQVNFSGMGECFAAQDVWAAQSPGPIHDRSREHLATSDAHIVAARRLLLAGIAAVQGGRAPVHVIRDPAQDNMSHIVVASEVIPEGEDHRQLWKRKMPDVR